ncbi:MAG: hypothetical protein HS111_28855 [Kofleriaceae bacterium]|nr:hypothetical protein [Kofleriaceae bacterium]
MYRQGQTPPATWRSTTDLAFNDPSLTASAFVLTTDYPELATHTGVFVIEIRATDRLGNVGPATALVGRGITGRSRRRSRYCTRGWPLQVSTDPLFEHSIFQSSPVRPVGSSDRRGRCRAWRSTRRLAACSSSRSGTRTRRP